MGSRPRTSPWVGQGQAWGGELLPPSISPKVPPFASFSTSSFQSLSDGISALMGLSSPGHLWNTPDVRSRVCLFTQSHGSLMSEVLGVGAGSPAKGRPRRSLQVHSHLPGLLGPEQADWAFSLHPPAGCCAPHQGATLLLSCILTTVCHLMGMNTWAPGSPGLQRLGPTSRSS